MIIGLAGYGRVGKDTVASRLVSMGFRQEAFARRLKQIVHAIDPLLEEDTRLSAALDLFGEDGVKDQYPEYRKICQELGVAARRRLGANVWVDAVMRDIRNNEDVVISDVRFFNELTAIWDVGGEVYRVTRPGVGPANEHISEVGLDTFDLPVIANHGRMSDIDDQLEEVLHGGTHTAA